MRTRWLKIFALSFVAGIVSGVVMSYEFGMNWSVFSRRAGPIVGPLMTYEVLTAFFPEAGFLGIMLYGVARVGKGLHLFATIAGAAHLFALMSRRNGAAFLTALALVALLFLALAHSLYPLIIPPNLSIWQTHAPGASMGFVLAGAAVLIPIILIYTGHAYWTFRGKVTRAPGD